MSAAVLKCNRLHFLDTPFDLVSEANVLDFLSCGMHAERGFQYIVTPNADHVVRNRERPDLLPIYEHALLSVCDSHVVARLACAKGFPIYEIVTGSDLTLKLFNEVIKPEHKVTVIGCDEESIALLKRIYRLEHLFHHNPKMGFIHDEEEIRRCCEFVAENSSDFILLAVGSPQQEILAARLKETPGCSGVGLCIGASLLFLTGRETRAPRFFSRLGIEWLFRLSQNPQRLWRRYYHDLKIFSMAFKSRAYDGRIAFRVIS